MKPLFALSCILSGFFVGVPFIYSQFLDARTEFDVGMIAFNESNYQGAIEHFERAVAMEPAAKEAHYYLARSYEDAYVESENTPDNDRLNARAIQEYEWLLQRDPSDTEVINALGHRYFRTARLDDAERYYRRALEIRPDNTEAQFLLSILRLYAQDGRQQFASLGDFKLTSGEVLRDCRIGYRTFGGLDADKSNVILMPTWATGTTEQLQGNVGPGKLADSSRYFVVLVDALANGVSSSPSTSHAQPHMKFPRITIRDMVNSQHELLTRELGIHHVKAVMGISMGGMQTFQWMVSYPDFMDKAIPIVGSPRLAPYDLVLWKAEIDAIKRDAQWSNGEYTGNPATLQLAELGALVGETSLNYNRKRTREDVFASLEKEAQGPNPDANDHIRQMEAMMSLDVSDVFNDSMPRAAAAVQAKVLVIVATFDHVVTPGPAKDFAKLLGAEVLEFPSDCGHQTPACEEKSLVARVAAFLAP